MVRDQLQLNEIKKFERQNILGCVEQVQKILSHPYPQNRSTSYPYVVEEQGFSMFKMDKYKEIKKGCKIRILNIEEDKEGNILLKNGRLIPCSNIICNKDQDDYFIAKEETGLLSLTARDDDWSPFITKEVLVDMIYQLINQKITKYQEMINNLNLDAPHWKQKLIKWCIDINNEEIEYCKKNGGFGYACLILQNMKKHANYPEKVAEQAKSSPLAAMLFFIGYIPFFNSQNNSIFKNANSSLSKHFHEIAKIDSIVVKALSMRPKLTARLSPFCDFIYKYEPSLRCSSSNQI